MNCHSATQSRGTRRSQGRAAARRNTPTPCAPSGYVQTKRGKNSGSIPGIYEPTYKNTGVLSTKIFWIPGVYRPKHRNTGGSSKINPLIFSGNSDKPPVLEKKQINPRYWENSDKYPVLDPNFFCPWFGPTLMARSSVSALRLAAARPRDVRHWNVSYWDWKKILGRFLSFVLSFFLSFWNRRRLFREFFLFFCGNSLSQTCVWSF